MTVHKTGILRHDGMQQQLTAICGNSLADEMRITLTPEVIIQQNLSMPYVKMLIKGCNLLRILFRCSKKDRYRNRQWLFTKRQTTSLKYSHTVASGRKIPPPCDSLVSSFADRTAVGTLNKFAVQSGYSCK